MKAPAFMFYTGDFLSSPDVQLMEAHEVGAYCLLLFNSWQSDRPGFLPADEGRLRRIARLSAAQWTDSRELLLGKFPLDAAEPALRYNPRLLREAEKQLRYRELKSRAGQASAAKRAAQPTSVASAATPAEQVLNTTTGSSPSSTTHLTDVDTEPASVAPASNTCSETAQHEGNLSVSFSNLSSLRSEREAAKPAAPFPRSTKKPLKEADLPPTLAAVQAYADEQYSASVAGEEAAAFFDHFQSNGWRVGGKTLMVDWRAAFRSWMRRRSHFQAAPGAAQPAPTRARTAPKPNDPTRWS